MAEEFSNYYTAALNTESKEIMDVHVRLDPRNMLPKKTSRISIRYFKTGP